MTLSTRASRASFGPAATPIAPDAPVEAVATHDLIVVGGPATPDGGGDAFDRLAAALGEYRR